MTRKHSIPSLPVALAFAVALGTAGSLAADSSGWRVDLKIGRSSLDETFGTERPKFVDDSAGASSIEVGYFFSPYVGVQAGYHDLGTFEGTGTSCPFDPQTCRESLALYAPARVEADVTGWSLAVVPTWPFTEKLSAYGKLGLFDRETEVSSDAVFIDGSRDFERRTGTDLLTGVGVRYRLLEHLDALVEYQRVEIDSAALGVSWTF